MSSPHPHNHTTHTIISYLYPELLSSFLHTHQINPLIPFKYDASKYKLKYDQFKHIFRKLPNIKLTGLNVSGLKSIKKLKHILKSSSTTTKFILKGSFNDINELCDYHIAYLDICTSTPNLELDLMPFDDSIHYLNINNSYNINITNIHVCTNLKSFIANHYDYPIDIANFQHCPKIRTLKISKCINFDAMLNLTNIRTLRMFKSNELNLPTLNKCALRSVNFSSCKNLTNIDGLKGCLFLQSVAITSCNNLQNINSLEGCINMRVVDICRCKKIENINVLNDHNNLHTLKLSQCDNLRSMGNINKNLRRFIVYSCKKLVGIENVFVECAEIEHVDICDCFVESAVSINCMKLRTCNINYCAANDLSFLAQCTELEYLSLDACIGNLQNFINCTKLKKMEILNCENLVDLSGLSDAGYEQLRELQLGLCYEINLDDINKCVNLTHLDIYMCDTLVNLKILLELTHLTHLILSSCKNLENIDDLCNVTNLSNLRLTSCEILSNYDSLSFLTKLQTITLHECPGLRAIPNLSKSIISEIKIIRCEKLTNISELSKCHHLNTVTFHNNCGINSKNIFPLFECKNVTAIYGSHDFMAIMNKHMDKFNKNCEFSLSYY